jgi:ABC-type multidrug transport system, ATPase component
MLLDNFANLIDKPCLRPHLKTLGRLTRALSDLMAFTAWFSSAWVTGRSVRSTGDPGTGDARRSSEKGPRTGRRRRFSIAGGVVRRLRRVPDPRAVDRIIDRIGLTPYRDKKAGVLSQGNWQRLGLAKTLIHRPDVVPLDEPTPMGWTLRASPRCGRCCKILPKSTASRSCCPVIFWARLRKQRPG